MTDLATGVGNPLSPYTDELLSVDDEKRIDDKGLKVAEGLLWSEAKTDQYLWIALWKGSELTQLVPGGRNQSDIDVSNVWGGNWQLSLGMSQGKPRFNKPTVGAAIEIPLDLGEDSIKQQYFGEWVSTTVVEALQDRQLPIEPSKVGDLGILVARAADRAIGGVL
jgi:hypothetical protein